jgi:biopolymer transport protein TolR
MLSHSPYKRKKNIYKPMAEINMTPFVDVMLALLIIFMIAAPLMSVGIPVDLPETTAKQVNDETEPLVITVNKEGEIFVQERKVSINEIVPLLISITKNNPNPRIFVRGDKALAYGHVVKLMGTVTTAGFTRVALVAELPE